MKHTGKILLLLGFSLSALAGPPAYKWVDPDGVVHYLETPPENVTCETLELDDPLSEDQVAAARMAYEQVIRDLAERRGADLKKRQQTLMTPHQRRLVFEYLSDTCVRALRNVLVLGVDRPVYYDDTGEVHCDRSRHSQWYEGNRQYLDVEQREILNLVWRDQIWKFCSDELTEKEIDKLVEEWLRLRTKQYCDYWRAALGKARKFESESSSGEIESLETTLERFCY